MMSNRFDTFFMDVALRAAMMSSCPSRSVGAVVVADRRIVATGFNGVPSGYPHPSSCKRRDLCIPSGERLDLCVCIHAEANAIANAARSGACLASSKLYCTHKPCQQCMGLIVNAGISEVVYLNLYPEGYDASNVDAIASHAGVSVEQFGYPSGYHMP